MLAALSWAVVLSRFSRRKISVWVARPRQQDLVELKALLESGQLVPVIDRRYPLEQVPEACLMAGHPRGKVVIAMHEQATIV